MQTRQKELERQSDRSNAKKGLKEESHQRQVAESDTSLTGQHKEGKKREGRREKKKREKERLSVWSRPLGLPNCLMLGIIACNSL